MSEPDLSKMRPGGPHYKAYVGPPLQYDFMGATQFRLLCTLGLRARHSVLDFGCGSLRAGRLLIPYLDRGGYYGVEPNAWLIEGAIAEELGADLIRIKKPTFSHSDAFDAEIFGRRFDFVVAQSIFSHTGPDLVRKLLAGFRRVVADDGLVAATFIEGDEDWSLDGWKYPGSVTFRSESVLAFAAEADLHGRRIPWFHPRQTWYLFARDERRLPRDEEMRFLLGAVLRDPEFEASRPND